MALGDWINSVFGSNADTTPASQQLANAGYQQYVQTGQAPTTGYGVATAAGSGGVPYQGVQQGLLNQLQAQAAGSGPNVAQQQLQQATQQNIANQAALAAGNATGNQNPGVAGANLARNAALAQQTAAGQSAMTRSQQELGAQQNLAGLTGQGINQAQAGANALNQEGQYASGQNQQNYQYGQNMAQSEQDAYNNAIAAMAGNQESQRANNGNAFNSMAGNFGFGVLNAGGKALMSDEDEKTDTAPAEADHEKFLEAMKSHSYRYKDPSMDGAAPGTHFGPMAQEIEKGGPVGKSLVHDGPDGVKRVDTDRMTLALASASGQLHQRVSALEAMLKDKFSKKAAAHG